MINRILLLLVAIIAGTQIVAGIESYKSLSIVYFTLSFGVFVIAAVLMLVSDVRIIENNYAALAAATLPLGFSLGLVAEFDGDFHLPYLFLLLTLFIGLVYARIKARRNIAIVIQIGLHGLSGLVLFIYPVFLMWQGTVQFNYLWISLGTGLVALGGMSLALLKSGHPIIQKQTIYKIFPAIFLLTAIAYSVGIGSYGRV